MHPLALTFFPSVKISIVTVSWLFRLDCGVNPYGLTVLRWSVVKTVSSEPRDDVIVPTPPPPVEPSLTKTVENAPAQCENISPKQRLPVPPSAVPATASLCRSGPLSVVSAETRYAKMFEPCGNDWNPHARSMRIHAACAIDQFVSESACTSTAILSSTVDLPG